MKKIAITLFVSIVLAGCAGKMDYIPPQPVGTTKNTITINQPKDMVWKKIIPSLGASFFVINNIDKDSGFINISYSGDPEKYVDCGTIDSFVKNARGERHYVFPASIGYKEYETLINGQLVFYKRKMNLEGRVNIVVQEVTEQQTLVSVNTKYIVTKDIYMSNPQNQSQHLNDNISFNTNGSGMFPNGRTNCYSTGELEKEILSAIGL